MGKYIGVICDECDNEFSQYIPDETPSHYYGHETWYGYLTWAYPKLRSELDKLQALPVPASFRNKEGWKCE